MGELVITGRKGGWGGGVGFFVSAGTSELVGERCQSEMEAGWEQGGGPARRDWGWGLHLTAVITDNY